MKVKMVLTVVAVLVLAGALIVWGGAGASVAQAQEPEPTPAPTEPPPPPPEEPQPPSDPSKSGTSGEQISRAMDSADLDRPLPAAAPAGWQMNFKFIDGNAFHPRSSAMNMETSGSGGCTYASASAIDITVADVQLPDGAVVDIVRFFWYDTSASDSYLYLTDYDGLTGDFSLNDIGYVTSSGTGGFDDAAFYPADYVVDTYGYPLLLNWRPNVTGSTMQLCGVRIRYWTPPVFGTFMPLIQR